MRGYIFTGLCGVLLGMLLAPKKGSELRSSFKEMIEDFSGDAAKLTTAGLSKGSELLDEAVKTGLDIKTEAQERIEAASVSVEHAKELAKESVNHLKSDLNGIV